MIFNRRKSNMYLFSEKKCSDLFTEFVIITYIWQMKKWFVYQTDKKIPVVHEEQMDTWLSKNRVIHTFSILWWILSVAFVDFCFLVKYHRTYSRLPCHIQQPCIWLAVLSNIIYHVKHKRTFFLLSIIFGQTLPKLVYILFFFCLLCQIPLMRCWLKTKEVW